ncbi:DUF6602 domain-containing protein [Engelhardtia mirabilis]|uniref:DUF6602 domain-containing protein n=1 Tax=Engelhardtia mirabilis TaxID=2528011 RepID=A0A518BRQ6_9BACT|nr:hypothetical protein Pla133_47570 [Planctomycetes bacterium Pla133]QDV03962.1 hypothetical protein Pla86_47550 [Planctomycetes bacterium Pla86]
MPRKRKEKEPIDYGPKQALKDLTDEIRAVECKIRNLIGDAHWGTDGAHKEAVLRALLRERLPKSLDVATGFVLHRDQRSRQVDILVIEGSKPVFMRDGDFVICGADAVVGMIEVKSDTTRWAPGDWSDAISHLQDSATPCRQRANEHRTRPPFVGLFALHGNENAANNAMKAAASLGDPTTSSVNHLCVGSEYFCRIEESSDGPTTQGGDTTYVWQGYELTSLAFGYFIGNLMAWIDIAHGDEHVYRYFPVDKQDGPKLDAVRVLD